MSHTDLSSWQQRLQKLSARLPTVVEPIPSARVTKLAVRLAAVDHRQEEIKNSPPTTCKRKFSTIEGPSIYYDGEAQRALFECWRCLGEELVMKRRELRDMKREGWLEKIEFLIAADGQVEIEERGHEEKEEKEEERRKSGVESICSYLEEAAKGCETISLLWLKGEDCSKVIDRVVESIREVVAIDKANSGVEAENGL